MVKAFQKFLETVVGQIDNSSYLLAVSGGIDSMVMLDLFHQSGLKFAVANVNFKLRGVESDNDSLFVKKYCSDSDIPFFYTEFYTEDYAKQNKLSTQMAARNLRYQWFNEMAKQESFDFVAIAHHLDDQTETFLINLIRGTGIAGMHGMNKQRDNIIRPLLFANRDEITNYASLHNVTYREDSSNASDKYQRNYIRHHILPHLHHLRSDFSTSLDKSLGYLNELELFSIKHIQRELASLIKESKDAIFQIETAALLEQEQPKLILFYALRDYNFLDEQVNNILELIRESKTGKIIQSSSHQIIVDRQILSLEPKTPKSDSHFEVKLKDLLSPKWNNFNLEITFPYKGNYKSPNSNLAFIDYDKLEFPLTLRNWQEGDSFQPLGMRGMKKLSDFFIDQKFTQKQKQNTLLLCSDNKIVWIIGHRIDHRFSIQQNTKHILKLKVNGNS